MKQHTQEFKEKIKEYGRQQDVIITYTLDGQQRQLGMEELNGVTPSFEASILKSVMKQLDLDSNVDIPLGTELNLKWGLYVNDASMQKNIFNGKLESGAWAYNNGLKVDNASQMRSVDYIDVEGQTQISIVKKNGGTFTVGIRYYADDKSYIGRASINNATDAITTTIVNNLDDSKSVKYATLTFTHSTDTSEMFAVNKGVDLTWHDYIQIVEYLDYGKYIVYSSEKNEDDGSYTIVCYDKLINSMKDYEQLDITYPVTIREFIGKLAEKLGLEFKNANDTFVNYDKQLTQDFFTGIDFTYRDVLDDLAEVTASVICLDNQDKLELREINDTGDTIDEEYLKDTNVTFGETFGPINSVVLSRSSSDNIYRKDFESEEANGLCEIKISDNQIMNNNDRDQYIDEIFNKLKGFKYTICDFTSTGIMYYDLLDKFNVTVGEKTYEVILFNDEQDITQGLEEQIYVDEPETSETDYTKADKTDQKINQTNLIVDKQNQTIQGIITQIGDRSEKETSITADIDGLRSEVSNIQDVTDEIDGNNSIVLENCIKGPALELHVYGNNTVFKPLFPSDNLYPSDNLFPQGDSRINVISYLEDEYGTASETPVTTQYELGIKDVLRQNGNFYDEYVLKDGTAKVIRRINKDGTIKNVEEIEDLGTFAIQLENGQNTIEIVNYNARMYAKFAIQNDYTDIFTTKVEMNSSIEQTADKINLEVNKKVDSDEIIASINLSTEKEEDGSSVQIKADKISLEGKTLNLADNMEIVSNNFNVDSKGNMTCSNATLSNIDIREGGRIDLGSADSSGIVRMQIDSSDARMTFTSKAINCSNRNHYPEFSCGLLGDQQGPFIWLGRESSTLDTRIHYDRIETPKLTQTSLASQKKNFEKMKDNAIDIIKQIDIYKYNLKDERDRAKKHIGFVIGDEYNYSKEVTSDDNTGVDDYSFISLCCKAIQEQQKTIEELQNRIDKLEKGDR